MNKIVLAVLVGIGINILLSLTILIIVSKLGGTCKLNSDTVAQLIIKLANN